MPHTDRVNGEFEVGYSQTFEDRWYYAELVGRVLMVGFLACGLAGLLGRGPLSHRRTGAAGLSVDYEPVMRHGTPSTLTIHVDNPTADPRPVVVSIGQTTIEPMGLQGTLPPPEGSRVAADGVQMRFVVAPNQADALIRLNLAPTALGTVQQRVEAGGQSVAWSSFVAP